MEKEHSNNIITKIVVTSSDSVLPMDVALQAHLAEEDVVVKETCFGLMVSGEREKVEKMIAKIRNLDPNGIFVKERGFGVADKRRCRASRGGGPRPGFYFLKEEGLMLPMIRGALHKLDKHAIVPSKKRAEDRVKPEDILTVAERYS